MIFTAAGMIREARNSIPDLGLTEAILLLLVHEAPGITMHETALLTGFPQSTVSRAYTALSKVNWPTRGELTALVILQPHSDKRRELAIILTDAARELLTRKPADARLTAEKTSEQVAE